MDSRQVVALQRMKARETLGILRGVSELFGTEDGAVAGDTDDLFRWEAKIDELERWIFGEGPIA